jgi:hypothetical protein
MVKIFRSRISAALIFISKFFHKPILPLAEFLFLCFIFSISFVLRYIGLKFSSPLITHGDETSILWPVFNMAKNKTLNPDNFQRPDQILYILNFFYLNIVSFIKTGKSFADTFLTNQYVYYFYSRILIVTFGSLMSIIAYKIGKESSIDYSIPAAFLFAFFPLYVQHSHWISPDIPITFFSLIIILFSMRYIRTIDSKYLYLATIFASINTAEKYPGLISLGIVFFTIIWVEIKKNSDQLGLKIKRIFFQVLRIFGLYILILYIIAPNIFIEYGKVIEQIAIENRTTHLGADGLGWLGNMSYYLNSFLTYSNFILILFAIFGMVGVVKEKKFEILPCFFGLVYWACLSVLALHWERWALPMFTFPLLLAAFGFGYLWKLLRSKQAIRSLAVLVFSLSMIWSILFSLSISIRMTYSYTTVVALNYCNQFGITADNSVYEGYTPFNPGGPNTFNQSKITGSTEYIILSSSMYNRYYNEPIRYADQINQYENIKKEYTLINQFTPTHPISSIDYISWLDDLLYYIQRHLGIKLPDRFTGPTILLYQVR